MNPITNDQIDALLDQHRPDRYNAENHAWRAPVIAAVASRMPVAQAQQIAAERMVGEREGRATRSVNGLLRKIGEERQWPHPELVRDLERRPLSIGHERVCLVAATIDDFKLWAVDERRDAAQEFSARSTACDGAEWIADDMAAKGYRQFGDGFRQDGAA